MSRARICTITAVNDTTSHRTGVRVVPLQLLVDLEGRLGERKRPPTSMMMSRPEISWPNTSNNGVVSPITHEMPSSSRIRITIASPSPTLRASRLLVGGELAGQDRDEHDVVDAEHDLERGERDERQPDVGVAEPIHRREA